MTIEITNARLCFPALFEAQDYQGDGNFKYKAVLLIPKDSPQVKSIKQQIIKLLNDETKGKGAAIWEQIKAQANKCCFRDGDQIIEMAANPDTYSNYEGMMAFTAQSKTRPGLFDKDGETPLDSKDGRPYAGCYVNAFVELFAYNSGGWGVSAGLAGVQFAEDGDAFGGTRPVKAGMFRNLTVGADAEDMA